MQECHNNVDGVCTIATYMAMHEVTVRPTDETCRACIAMEHPRAMNKATCGLALLTLMKEGRLDKARHRHLRDCAATHYSMDGTLANHPGRALRRILHGIGVQEPANCYCQEYAASMDSWGHAGCVRRRQEIIDHLNAQDKSWFDIIKVAAAGYLSTAALVDHALEISQP